MSAICGLVNRIERKPLDAEIVKMTEPFAGYHIDRESFVCSGRSYFYCAHQHVTPEAEREVLPLEDDEILFTADAVLDNREELIAELKVNADTPDGELIYRAYKKWGEASVKKLLGVFSYAIYDKLRDCFLLYTDHTGSRSIHYCVTEARIMFSTLAKPILNLLEGSKERFNERWLSFCESIINPDMYFYPGDSAFEGICLLEPGHYVRVADGRVEKICYWNPMSERKQLPKMTDEEYRRLFLETFEQCVSSVLRSSGETGITLSSGLDSSAVACMAAPILERRGKKLYSYTSVPLPDFPIAKNAYLRADESHGPRQIAARYRNVEPEFVSCEERSLFGQIPKMVELLEVPCKSFANLLWMNTIYEKAVAKNCRLVIKGQYGNSTISYGAVLSLLCQKLQTGHPYLALQELKSFMRTRGVGKRQVVHAIRSELAGKFVKREAIRKNSFLRRDLIKKYRVDAHLQKSIRTGGGSLMDTVSQHRKFVYSMEILQHLGLFDTKLGLIHGMIVRDPTKDKRMIELCMMLPPECFVHNGVERRMVREYMKGIVPEEIRQDVNHRGEQSADIVFRANKEWAEHREEFCRCLEHPRIRKYLDEERLHQLSLKIGEKAELKDKESVQTVIALWSFGAFLKIFEKA